MTHTLVNKLFFLLLLTVMAFPTIAQKGITLQYEPTFSYTKGLSNRWSVTSKLASRNTFLDTSEEGTIARYQLNFLEAQFFGTYNLWNSNKLGIGYTFRATDLLESPGFEHRSTEQIAFVTNVGNSHLAHRVRAEQRSRTAGYTNRLRYRLSYDKPLNGQELDPGEKYIVVSDELLYTFNAVESSAENRISLSIGWLLQKGRKFEIGIQHRLDDIGSQPLEHTAWFTTTYYISQ